MATNKGLNKQAIYYWDEDLKKWRPVNFNFSTNGSLVVTTYSASPIHVIEASPTGINGGPVTVGTTAVEMTFSDTTKVISLKAASTNTGKIWFGPSTVTNAGLNAFGELTADSAVEIGFDDSNTQIYCVSDTAAQKVYKCALT